MHPLLNSTSQSMSSWADSPSLVPLLLMFISPLLFLIVDPLSLLLLLLLVSIVFVSTSAVDLNTWASIAEVAAKLQQAPQSPWLCISETMVRPYGLSPVAQFRLLFLFL